MAKDLAFLDEESHDLREVAGIGSIIGVELGDDGNGLGGVDGLAFAEEIFDSDSVWVQITSISITDAAISIRVSTFLAGAFVLTIDGTWMRSIGFRNRVGFPNVQLSAARSELACTSFPSFSVGLTINEFEVIWALGIAITSTILGTSSVTATDVSILVHLNEIKSTIETAWKVSNISCEGELLVQKFELLV